MKERPDKPKPNQWSPTALAEFDRTFRLGTTSVEAADKEGWVVSVTPSGGWLPAVIAGKTGIGMSQRMQSFVLDAADNPFNVVAPGKRPRATLTPSLALKDGKPMLAFAVQGGDTQDQNLLQFFLNVVEFGMTVQEAAEAANITSYQMRDSFGAHESFPGRADADELDPGVGAQRADAQGLQARVHAEQLRPDHRDLRRSPARLAVGRGRVSRRRLWHRLVNARLIRHATLDDKAELVGADCALGARAQRRRLHAGASRGRAARRVRRRHATDPGSHLLRRGSGRQARRVRRLEQAAHSVR